MPLAPLFEFLLPIVRERFELARADAGIAAGRISLQIEEERLNTASPHRAEFSIELPSGPVRITWSGIASLWVLCQSFARISRRMFESKRAGKTFLEIGGDVELERGVMGLELARRLLLQDVPPELAVPDKWPTWAPEIEPSSQSGPDNDTGNRFFGGALDFIFRHELAHVFLGHPLPSPTPSPNEQKYENEADEQAVIWLRGEGERDVQRLIGQTLSEAELKIEWNTIAVGVGLIWVASFEAEVISTASTHPPVSERLQNCVEKLGIREDSAAGEILADILQCWLDPEGSWAPEGGYRNAQEALFEALFRLHRTFTP